MMFPGSASACIADCRTSGRSVDGSLDRRHADGSSQVDSRANSPVYIRTKYCIYIYSCRTHRMNGVRRTVTAAQSGHQCSRTPMEHTGGKCIARAAGLGVDECGERGSDDDDAAGPSEMWTVVD